jgi:hypothetical protein
MKAFSMPALSFNPKPSWPLSRARITLFIASAMFACKTQPTQVVPTAAPSPNPIPIVTALPTASGAKGAPTAAATTQETPEAPRPSPGTVVTPKVELAFSEETGPEFRQTALPAVSSDGKLLAYFSVDRDPTPTANQNIVLLDTTTGKPKTTLMLAKTGELENLADEALTQKEPWQSRIKKANEVLEKNTWKALAFSDGADLGQPPTELGGLHIGFPKGKPRQLAIRNTDGTTLVEQDVSSWYIGKSAIILSDIVASDSFVVFSTSEYDAHPAERKIRLIRLPESKAAGADAGAMPQDAGKPDAAKTKPAKP